MDTIKQTAIRNANAACEAAERAADDIAAETADLNADALPDIGAKLKRAMNALAECDKAVKARILAEADGDTLKGSAFTARIVESVRWTLDSKAIKEEMGEDWTTARSKCATVRSVRYAV